MLSRASATMTLLFSPAQWTTIWLWESFRFACGTKPLFFGLVSLSGAVLQLGSPPPPNPGTRNQEPGTSPASWLLPPNFAAPPHLQVLEPVQPVGIEQPYWWFLPGQSIWRPWSSSLLWFCLLVMKTGADLPLSHTLASFRPVR